MATAAPNGSQPALGSDWGGLSPHLIASFYAVKKEAAPDGRSFYWRRDTTQPEVRAPLTEASAEATLNWQSPFENIGPDQKFGTLGALLQSGGFTSLLQALKQRFGGDVFDAAIQTSKDMEGRSSFTKLNSTQVFNGMPPLRINVTAHFRAWSDARREVRDPMNQLMAWALPQQIAEDGLVVRATAGDGLNPYPSMIPQLLAMSYAGMLFQPIVIETIPYPLSGPRDGNGHLTHASLTMNLASLAALDRRDWGDVVAGQQQTSR